MAAADLRFAVLGEALTEARKHFRAGHLGEIREARDPDVDHARPDDVHRDEEVEVPLEDRGAAIVQRADLVGLVVLLGILLEPAVDRETEASERQSGSESEQFALQRLGRHDGPL